MIMRQAIRLGSFFLMILLLFKVGFAESAPHGADARSPATESEILWCATPKTMRIEEVSAGACVLTPLRSGDISRAPDQRAFWLRLVLTNPESSRLKRWVTVGHPRLSHVSLWLLRDNIGSGMMWGTARRWISEAASSGILGLCR